MILYRAIKLEQNDQSVILKCMGLCWTSDWARAFPYGYKQQIDTYFIYTAKVADDCIDAEKTELMYNGSFNYEREVVLKRGADIEVIRIDTVTIFPPVKEGEDWAFTKTIKTINTRFKTKA